MSNQSKRLSDVTKQTTVDRTSKLVSGLLPSTPVAPPAADVEETKLVEPAASLPPAPTPPVVDPQPAPAASQKPERARKSATPANFVELITQPFPVDLRCDKPIMLTATHHQMLRVLSFTHNKPMTEILYNLLEAASQPYQREQQKDV